MTNPEFHTCPDCGYKWRHGQHGGHSCTDRLIKQRDELLSALKSLEREFRKVFPVYYYAEPWAHDRNLALKFAGAVIAKVEGSHEQP